MDIQTALPIMQLILAFANICVIGYGFYKFLNKPHDNLESRISTLESSHQELKTTNALEHKELKESLLKGNDRFREQDDTNEVLIRSVFALLEFEVHYCETEQKPITKNLEKAKDDLHEYLARK